LEKENVELKEKIREFIKKELPDDEIMECCSNYDVNGVAIRKELEKILEDKEYIYMNKEEREIIYTLEGSIDTYIEGTKVIKVQLTTKQAEILLNLISKLQKENEELKEKIKEYEIGMLKE